MKADSDSNADEQMRDEYDLSGGVRERFYQKYTKGTNVVLLDPDEAAVFHHSETVNQALRKLISQNEASQSPATEGHP